MATAKKNRTDSRRRNIAKNVVPVRLVSLEFTEFPKDPKEWLLEKVLFDQVNLIVGKNASGKSRLLNVIAGLAAMLSGKRPKVFRSGKYKCEFAAGKNRFVYELECNEGSVVHEALTVDGRALLKRGKSGVGRIWAERIGQEIDFETPSDQLAARTRRDSIQHPFFEDLHTWARLLRHYQFGTPLGKDRLLLVNEAELDLQKPANLEDSEDIVRLYTRAFAEFREPFDRRVLADLSALGYECTDVGVELVDSAVVQIGGNVAWLFVKERELQTKTSQLNMSQGMFRALALVIHLNYCLFSGVPRTILIDDIGEGLDFSRAQSFINLLIKHSEENDLQLMMTTNDRFVMNGVPLENWGVLKRTKSTVKLINRMNTPKVFDEFAMLGLNNFDFFATNFFEEGLR